MYHDVGFLNLMIDVYAFYYYNDLLAIVINEISIMSILCFKWGVRIREEYKWERKREKEGGKKWVRKGGSGIEWGRVSWNFNELKIWHKLMPWMSVVSSFAFTWLWIDCCLADVNWALKLLLQLYCFKFVKWFGHLIFISFDYFVPNVWCYL